MKSNVNGYTLFGIHCFFWRAPLGRAIRYYTLLRCGVSAAIPHAKKRCLF